MDIKVLGTGCQKCKELERRTVNALAELNIAADIEKVTDIRKIMEYGILSTPGLVIDGKVKASGRIPRPEEIKTWILEAK